MKNRNFTDLTDQELLQEAKKTQTKTVINAALIGFLLGIVIYSVIQNTWGLLMLIPLVFAYFLVKKSNAEKQELQRMLKARKLKN